MKAELVYVLSTMLIVSLLEIDKILDRIIEKLRRRYQPQIRIVAPTGKAVTMYRSEVTSEKIKEFARKSENAS